MRQIVLAVKPRRNGWKIAIREEAHRKTDEIPTGASDHHWRPLFYLVDVFPSPLASI